MKHVTTRGIVLTRVDYQEADRIITLLTPDQGKVRIIAKGVRRAKSKLAGGLELFSVTEITYIQGRSEISTVVSTRLERYFESIVKDIQRTMLGYDFLKRMNRITEDAAEEVYFTILGEALAGLNDASLDAGLVELWFTMNLLHASGHRPNLQTDTDGAALQEDQSYMFELDNMAFACRDDGQYNAQHIKLLRLAAHQPSPSVFTRIANTEQALKQVLGLAKNLAEQSAG